VQLIFHRDIAAGAVLDMMSIVETQFGLVKWVDQHAELKRYWEMLEARESFKQTQPHNLQIW
jgi:hypothetical protein